MLGITVFGAVLRVFTIGAKGLWLDEAFSIWLARQSLPAMLGWLVRIDQHPPLYYTLLHFWLSLGDSEGTVRLLSALFSTLTIPVVYLLGRRLLGERAALLAALVLALSPFHVQFAQEARMYALLAFCASAVMFSLAYLLAPSAPSTATAPLGSQSARLIRNVHGIGTGLAWLTYVVCTAAALLTHSTAVFLPIAANLFVLGLMGWRRQAMRRHRAFPIASGRRYVWGDWVSLRNWLIAQALVLLLWSPWSVPFAIQAGGVYREFWIPRPSAGTILALIGTFLGTHLLGSVFWATVAAALLLPIAVLGGISLRRQPAVLVFLLTFLLTPIAGELLVSLRRPIFYDRTLIWASIPFYLLSAAGLARLRLGLSHCERSRALPALTLISALALLVAVNGLSLHGYYVDFQKEGWREAATYVTGQAKTGDLVLFNATWVQIPFDYYFQGTRRGVSERGAPANLFDRGVLEPKMTAGDLPRLYGLIQDRDRVWLVYSHNWYTDPEGLIPPALDQELTLLERREFTGLEIRLYARKTGQS